MSSEPTITESPIAEYRPTEALLADLRQQFGAAVFDVRKPQGMVLAKDARKTLRRKRVELEEARVSLKAPVIERGRIIDAEAKRIIGEIVALEEPIDQQIKAEENRKEDERRAKEQAELDRIAGIQERIGKFAAGVASLVGRSAEVIKIAIDRLTSTEITGEDYSEFVEQATAAKNSAIAQLVEMHTAAVTHEEAAAKLARDQAELEVLRKNAAAAQAIIDEANAKEAQRLADLAAEQQREADAREATRRQDAAAILEVERIPLRFQGATPEAISEKLAAIADEHVPVSEEAAEAARVARDKAIETLRSMLAQAQQAAQEAAARAESQQREAAELAERQAAQQREREALDAQRAQLEAEALTNVTLHDAAVTASAFLHELGQGQAQATRMLDAALSREPKA
jgi:colicin import membrane protein